MSPPTFLNYEVALLLAKYGKSAVLAALSKQLNLSVVQLEEMLQRLPAKRAGAGAAKQVFDATAAFADEPPAKAELLRTLHERYLNRTLLPELRDVKRFFERSGRSIGHVKSRAAALPKVMKLLAERDASDLEALVQTPAGDDYSSLGLISDQILHGNKR